MPLIIDLPQVGESVVEGIIGKWLKQPGETVRKYDALVEVVTDKVTMEVPSPVSGVIARLLVEEGETVPMGAPILEIDTNETPEPVPPTLVEAAAPDQPRQAASTTGRLVKDIKQVGPTGGGIVDSAAGSQVDQPDESEGGRRRYSPAVRRLAQEHSIDLTRVPGTGMGGRVTREDVERFIESDESFEAPPPIVETSTRVSDLVARAVSQDDAELPLTPVRRLIAQHMVRSASETPHAWTMVEADVTGLVRYRQSVREKFEAQEGMALTYLPFFIHALVGALKENPKLNSTWADDKIVLKKRLNVGIAVAAPEGLIVPVIHDADGMSITALARASRDLTARAREGRLALADVQGGTFTLNNTGALGSIASQPIINHPQAAIMTTEAVQKRPVVVGDGIAIRSLMNVCLSFDHRIIDGAESGSFLQAVKRRLEAIGPDTPLT